MGAIYRIRNTVNGKLYVGSTIKRKPSDRWGSHLASLRGGYHHSLPLQRAYQKHGESAFVFEIIEEVAIASDVIAREQHWLNVVRPFGRRGYNICPVAGNKTGVPRSQASRKRMADKMRGRTHSAETRQRISASVTGFRHTDAAKEKIGNASRGKRFSDERRAKIAAALSGKPKSPSHREAIAARNKRLGEAMRGVKKSAEHCESLRVAWIERKKRQGK